MRKRTLLRDIGRNPFLYLLALPGIVFVFVFSYVPMYGLLIAFKDFNIRKGILGSKWVGFSNFKFFITTDKLALVLRNTVYLNALFILATTFFAVLLALLLNEVQRKWIKRSAQSIIFLPYFMSWIVIGMLVQSFLGGMHPTVDGWLNALGIEPLNWYFEAHLWPWILTCIKVWQGAGYMSIIFLAAITSFPDEIYEAARIDGASKFQMMTRITVPLLIPTISILTILAVGKIFNGDFAMIYAIVGDNSMLFPTTDVIDTYVFRSMRVLNDFGMAAAVGLFQSVMGFIFVVAVNTLVKRFSRDSALF
ncbi:ABC transporter permease [Cohnella soli]|uniref:ABC transporter permease n=1 Tax=Cohnella soli TaxID=425005 RepID=A0ABW0HSM2_9BACL